MTVYDVGFIILATVAVIAVAMIMNWYDEKGKERMKIVLDEGAKLPTRGHEPDAGLDLYSRKTMIVPAKESAIFDTGVHIELPPNTAGILISKSGLFGKIRER